MFDRATIIDKAFTEKVRTGALPAALTGTTLAEAGLSGDDLVALFETQVLSRQLDLMARRSKGKTFYSIGSSGHEGMAALARAARVSDMAFLHYRDGAFLIERRKKMPGATPVWDMCLSFAASAEDPVSGGRHKVLGGKDIFVPPQTSTIASHLPKAVGAAHSIALSRKLADVETVLPTDAVILCSFGDASANHSTAQGAFNAAAWTAYQNLPMPIVFVCEDNDIGISVRTPKGWIEATYQNRPGLTYMACDGRDAVDAMRGARAGREALELGVLEEGFCFPVRPSALRASCSFFPVRPSAVLASCFLFPGRSPCSLRAGFFCFPVALSALLASCFSIGGSRSSRSIGRLFSVPVTPEPAPDLDPGAFRASCAS